MYPFKEKLKPSPMDMKILRRTRETQEEIQLGRNFSEVGFTICYRRETVVII
jgi:hypothetical protein